MICPKCGAKMVKRNGRYGEFYGCSNYPECRHTMETDFVEYHSIGKRKNKRFCPKCGANMVKRNGPSGEFYGCSNYPECTYTMAVDFVDYHTFSSERKNDDNKKKCPKCDGVMHITTKKCPWCDLEFES